MMEQETAQRINETVERSPTIVDGVMELLLRLSDEWVIELWWCDNRCMARSANSLQSVDSNIEIPRSVFRAILARVAVLCSLADNTPCSPYQGAGRIDLPTEGFAVEVSYSNRSAEQWIKLRRSTNSPALFATGATEITTNVAAIQKR